MPFSKNFFRLRRRGAKRRKSGYYMVHWSYAGDPVGIGDWRIAFYSEPTGTWSMVGDRRLFKDADFIAINENQVVGLFSRYRVVNVVLYIALLEMAWNAGYIIYNVIEYVYRLTK